MGFTYDQTTGTPRLMSDGTSDYIFGPMGTPIEAINVASQSPNY